MEEIVDVFRGFDGRRECISNGLRRLRVTSGAAPTVTSRTDGPFLGNASAVQSSRVCKRCDRADHAAAGSTGYSLRLGFALKGNILADIGARGQNRDSTTITAMS